MDILLFAIVDFTLLWVIVAVAVALGAVIFVHELGHFVVAKLCGVKVEKFYLGFDIYGLKLLKFRRGETEYGIGVLPLGGYVKMLGQEDNPAKLRAEMERAKQQPTAHPAETQPISATHSAELFPSDVAAQAAAPGGQSTTPAKQPPAPAEQSTVPTEQPPAPAEQTNSSAAEAAEAVHAAQALFDPRSYLAKSVPQRMAIISAGVVMNVIFAFFCAVAAYSFGVKQLQPVVGQVIAGSPAWKVGFSVGDRVEQIGNKPAERFQDLYANISMGDDLHEGIPIVVRRAGLNEPLLLRPVPVSDGLKPTIGVVPPYSTALSDDVPPAVVGSAAAAAQPPLEPGDQLQMIDDQPIEDYGQLHQYLAANPDRPIRLTVRRGGSSGELVETVVQPNPMRHLGVAMKMGPVCAIQHGSPAEGRLREGDVILAVDDARVDDPMRLSERLRRRTGHNIAITVLREGKQLRLEGIAVRKADRYDQSAIADSPVAVPELGVAYYVLNEVAEVLPASPAAAAGVSPGQVVQRAVVRLPAQTNDKRADNKEVTVNFSEKRRNWPLLYNLLQNVSPDSTVAITFADGRTVELPILLDPQWPNPDRGLLFQQQHFVQKADSLGSALRLGLRETADSLTMVVRFLRKIGTQVSPRLMGGPITIATAAGRYAYQGIPELLVFLTMLSANLAVLNFLPIPLLDGGHMVFLLWEGIRGKPADERVQLVLTYIGLALILALLLWVLALDTTLIPRYQD